MDTNIIFPIFTIIWVIIHTVINWINERRGITRTTSSIIDDKIPFIPLFSPFYFSIFAFVELPHFLFRDDSSFHLIVKGYLAISITGFITYILFPVRRMQAGQRFEKSLLLKIYRQRIKPYNAFPSVHNVFSAFGSLSIISLTRSSNY